MRSEHSYQLHRTADAPGVEHGRNGRPENKKKDLWLENLHEKEICFVVILGLRQFQILKNNKKKTLNTDILADISLGSGI